MMTVTTQCQSSSRVLTHDIPPFPPLSHSLQTTEKSTADKPLGSGDKLPMLTSLDRRLPDHNATHSVIKPIAYLFPCLRYALAIAFFIESSLVDPERFASLIKHPRKCIVYKDESLHATAFV